MSKHAMRRSPMCLLFVVPLVNAQLAPSDALNTKLNRRMESYHLAGNSLVEILARASTDFQIPMLIEWVDDAPSREPVVYDSNDATAREILEQIVSAHSGYELRIANGVVNVGTSAIPPEQNFLLLKIENFEVDDERIEAASRTLRRMVALKVVPLSSPKAREGLLEVSLLTTTIQKSRSSYRTPQ